MKAPTSAELTRLTQTLALRIGRYLESQGLLESDAENSYLAGDDGADGAAPGFVYFSKPRKMGKGIPVGKQQCPSVFAVFVDRILTG